MEARNIVAIEIASSKIKGAVAAVDDTGAITVLAVEETPRVNIVRHGRVQNVREVSAEVNAIIAKLENTRTVAPAKVKAVVLALGGRSLATSPASASISFARDLEVSEDTIHRLKKEAAKDFVSSKNIEETIARRFYVNNVEVKSAVGTIGSSLKGDFLIVSCARENRQNLERLKFDTVPAGSVYMKLRPTALADLVLSADDRQLGCVLVDFGAETTTVAVYKDGTLGYLATLPMGSRLITLDLMSGLNLTEAAAEDFKVRLGSLGAYDTSTPNAEEVNDYVRARAGEIAANIVNQIELSGFAPANLGAGIILAGQGAQLPEFGTMLASQSHMPLRHAAMPDSIAFTRADDADERNLDVVAIIAAAATDAEIDCLCRREPADPEPADPTDPEPVVPEPAPAPKPRVPDEDDDDLLEDDDDDDEPRTPRSPKRSDKKRQKPETRTEESEDAPDEDDDDDTTSPRGLMGIVDKIAEKIEKIFGPPAEADDEYDERDEQSKR